MKIKLTMTSIKKELEASLREKGGTLYDNEVRGFHIKRVGENVLSYRLNYTFNGNRKNITIGRYPTITPVQARNKAVELTVGLLADIDPLEVKKERNTQGITLIEYLKQDYAYYLDSRAKSSKQYIREIEIHFGDILDRPLDEVTKSDLIKWVNTNSRLANEEVKGYSQYSITHRYNALKSLFKHAMREGDITANPFDRMPPMSFKTAGTIKNRGYLSLDDQRAFLEAVDAYDQKLKDQRTNSRYHGKPYLPDLASLRLASHHKPMYLILYYMGMRIGDVVSLRWEHVNLNTTFTTAHISKVLNKTSRKVKEPYRLPIPNKLLSVLRDWHYQLGTPQTGFVFSVDNKGDKPLDRRTLKRSWVWIKERANLDSELVMYTLRHNFISWLVMSNINLSVIAKLSGHADTKMIEKHYSHLAPSTVNIASDAFGNLLADHQEQEQEQEQEPFNIAHLKQ